MFGYFIISLQFFGPGPHYSFGISSIENFEERLETAQKELGIPPEDFIPVKYKTENELLWAIFNAF